MSNYHFTPKPVVDDIQIKSNVSSIQMEEVLPMGVSVQSRLAPEEVFKKKRGREGVLIGEDELNKDERARKRRAKKTARRKARKAQKADEKAKQEEEKYGNRKHAVAIFDHFSPDVQMIYSDLKANIQKQTSFQRL